MQVFTETKRLILREILPDDVEGLFMLDSDPEVHRYLGNNPVSDREEIRKVIKMIRQQYTDNGIGRWAVVEKETGNFIGWSGLKLMREETNGMINYYDLGYRFIKKYWGMGFATEASLATLQYGFEKMGLDAIYAMAEIGNQGSKNVLEKSGLWHTGNFQYDNTEHAGYKITRDAWMKKL